MEMAQSATQKFENYTTSTRPDVFWVPTVTIRSAPVDYISNEIRPIISLIVNNILCLPLSIFGLVANIININVFIRQKSVDSITVGLAGLAVADFGALFFCIWHNILLIPELEELLLPLDTWAFVYMTGAWPHLVFVRAGSWITAFITLERCLCIVLPLKVKTLITTRRTVFIHLLIYTLVIASIAPMYYTNQFSWKFYPNKNMSLIGLTFLHNSKAIESIVLQINGNIIPMTALIVNMVCTTILVVKLRIQRKWRSKQGASGDSRNVENLSVKETKAIRMAVSISAIYIVCYGPSSLVLTWMSINPEFHYEGSLRNSKVISVAFTILLQAINSSVNIFVYYHMSSNYRSTFRNMAIWKECLKGE